MLIMSKDGKSKIISDIFDDFVNNHNIEDYEKFNTRYIFNHNLWMWNNKISLRPHLIEAGINPDCVFTSKRGLYNNTELFLNSIIEELIIILGRENLNDRSMNSSLEIEPPKSLRTKGKFEKTDKINFPLKKTKLKNIQSSLRTIFKCSWKDILLRTGNEDVERRISKNSPRDVWINYENYKKKHKIKSYTLIEQGELRKKDSVLWKQILKIINELNFSVNYTTFFTGICCLEYFKKEEQFPEKEFLLSKKIESDFREFLSNQKDVKWDNHPQILRDIVLGMYVRGSSIYGDDKKTDIEKRVLDKISHRKDKNSKSIYKSAGILIDELRNIKIILDSKYDRKQIYNKLRELLDKTITTGINHLSREYVEKNEKDFMNSCFKVERVKTNNWGKILELYGLNRDLFIPNRLDVSKRGHIFEKLIKNLFTKYLNRLDNKSHLKDQKDFWYKKKQGSMIPDFTFVDKIIDTKFSVSYSKNGFNHYQVRNQMEQYHKTKKDLIILTFNQKNDIIKQNKMTTKVINLKSLKKFMMMNFGKKINNNDLKYIYDEIDSIKLIREFK